MEDIGGHASPTTKERDMTIPQSSIRGFAVSVLLALSGLLIAAGSLAQSHSRPVAGSHGSPHRLGSHSVTRPQQPSRLLPPAGLGSATNAPPGFYRRHLSVPVPKAHPPVPGHHPAPIYVPYPYPVYVTPPEYALSPSQVGAPPPQDVLPQETIRPSAAPQPVYVIQAPAAPAAPRAPAPSPPVAAAPPPAPRSTEPAPVRFSIAPADAEVYLDDEFLGTGAELGAREQPLLLRPGVYVLEVTHPDLRDQRLVFGFRSDEATDVRIDLTAERPRRRSRIR